MEEIDGRIKQLPRRHQVHMVNEEDLVGHSVDVFLQTRGWIKQQILKLLFAEHVRAPFYITFDADVICCRPVSVDDLVIRGRAKASYQGKSVHPKWWQHSSAILKQPHKRDGIGHGVTPNIVSSKVVRRMIGHLGAMYGPGWIEHLCRNEGWTEYTLYSVFLENLGLLTRYHIDDRFATRSHPPPRPATFGPPTIIRSGPSSACSAVYCRVTLRWFRGRRASPPTRLRSAFGLG